MKIGRTRSGTRIGLTQAEYNHLGRPTHATAILMGDDGRLRIKGDPSGSTVYRQTSDVGHPVAFTLRTAHAFNSGRRLFGTEVVATRLHPDEPVVYSEAPKMNNDVISRVYRPRAGSKTAAVVSVPVERPAMTIEEAVALINSRKEAAGRNLVISVDADGFLELLHRTGR